MEAVGRYGGGMLRIQKCQVNATLAAGIIALAPGAGNAGLATSTTTSAANAVGLTEDGTYSPQGVSGTYQTAQQSDNSDPARIVSVIVNPDLIIKALLSGGATENTALSLQTVTTASTTGLAITTAAEWSNPTYDEGIAWGLDGANAGIARKVTSVSSTAGTLTVAFPYDTAVGDNFLRAPFWPFQTATLQLTTALTQVDASIAVGTGAALRAINSYIPGTSMMEGLFDVNGEGRTRSFVLFTMDDHVLNVTT